MRDKPNYCYDINCPLAKKGKGFALGCGDPAFAKVAIMFERPAADEIAFTFGGPRPPQIPEPTWRQILDWQRAELNRRKAAFPDLDTEDQRRFIFHGAPVRGMSGAEIRQWVLPTVGGGQLEDYYLENVLHCAAPDNEYPAGDIKEAAEACCVHWNRLKDFNPEASIVSLHPAGILKEQGGGIVALPLQWMTFSKAISFSRQGVRTLILAGGKAVKFWLGYAESVTRWAGHYIKETDLTWHRRTEKWKAAMDLLKANPTGLGQKKKRVKKEVDPERVLQRRSRKRAPEIPGMQVFGQ